MSKRNMVLLGLTTLLLGADGVELTTDDLPACAPNSYLVYRSGKIVCEATLPDCTGQLLHAGRGGDVAALSCIPKDQDSLSNADRQRVDALQAKAQSIFKRFDELGITPPLGVDFVGLTKATTAGRIEYPDTAAGLPAANALCAAEFEYPAHMCSVREMLGAVVNHTLDPSANVAKGWLYMPTWNTPVPGAEQPLAGLADNCGGYTDATDTHHWTGMAVDWNLSINLVRVLHFYSGAAAPCTMILPVACCR